jgi:cell division protein FtsN
MRDDEFDGAGDGPQEGARRGLRRQISIWSGAALALLLIAGGAWWAWDLATRDTARIPIIAAATGPIRVAAAEGAPPVEHADIGSYELGRGDGEGERETRLAPETPPPTEEDIALRDLEAILGISGPIEESEAPAPRPEPAAEQPGEAGLARRTPAVPAPAPRDVPAAAPEPDDGPTPPPGTGSDLAPAVSPVAPSRPGDLPGRMAAARAEAETDARRLASRAAEAPYQLQLGAFRSEAQTREEWAKIAAAHSELLHNRALAIQTTRSGGETFYRLRVGPFTSLAEAASVCEALLARDQPCITAENR